jgi:hypothetical protein
MKKKNYLALGAAAAAIFAVFLPWIELSGAGSTSEYSTAFQDVHIYGISIGYGIFGLLVILAGAIMAYKNYKWAFTAGIINFITGYGYLHQWFGKGTHDSANYGDVTSRSSVDPKFGLYLFIWASLAFMFFTLKNYKPKKTTAVLPSDPEKKADNQAASSTERISAPIYKPSKVQTMSTESSENPTTPVQPSETPIVPAQATETTATPATGTEEPVVSVTETAPETPIVPVQPAVTEPAPIINPEPKTVSSAQQQVEIPEQKKSWGLRILLIVLGIVIAGGAFFYMTNSSLKSNEKTKSVNDEKARLELIINEVNEAVKAKNYDEALLKINSINWLYEPGANKDYVDQYNLQRENLRKTIEDLKASPSSTAPAEPVNKATEPAEGTTQPSDSIMN